MTEKGKHYQKTTLNERSIKLEKRIDKFIATEDANKIEKVRMEDLNFYREEFKDVSSRLIDMGSISQVNLLDEINTTITRLPHSTLQKKVTDPIPPTK